MADNHVDYEEAHGVSIGILFGLQVDTSRIDGKLHHGDPTLVGHEDHQVEDRVEEVVEVVLRFAPIVAKVETVLLRIDSVICLRKLNVTVDHTVIEGAFKEMDAEDGEDDDDDEAHGDDIKNLLTRVDYRAHGDSQALEARYHAQRAQCSHGFQSAQTPCDLG